MIFHAVAGGWASFSMKAPFVSLCVFAACVGWDGAAASTASAPVEALEVGGIAPDFKVKDVDGRAVSFATWPDRAVVIYFGTARDDGGQRGLRRFESLAKSMEKDSAGFVAVLPDGAEELAAGIEYRKNHQTEIPLVQDVGGGLAREYGARRRPFVVVVDKDRLVRATHERFGVLSAASVKESVRNALAQPFAAQAVAAAAADPDADLPTIIEFIRKPMVKFKMAELHPAMLKRIDREERKLHVFTSGSVVAWDFDRDGRTDFCFQQPNGVMVLPGNGAGTMVVRLGSTRDGGQVTAVCPSEEIDGVGWFALLQGWDGRQTSWALALFGKDGRLRWSASPGLSKNESLYPRGVVSTDLDGDGRPEYVAGLDVYRVKKDKHGMAVHASQKSYLIVLGAEGRPICIALVGDERVNIGWMTATGATSRDRPGRIFCAINGTLQAFEFVRGAGARPAAAAGGSSGSE